MSTEQRQQDAAAKQDAAVVAAQTADAIATPEQQGEALKESEAPEESRLRGWFSYIRDAKFGFILGAMGLLGIFLLFGSVLIEHGITSPDAHTWVVFMKEVGVLCLAIFTTTLVHERILRKHSLKEMKKEMAETLEQKLKATLPNQIDDSVGKHFPPQYKNLKNSGIDNAFDILKTDRLYDEISKLGENSEVFLLKMWLSDIEKLEPAIRNATANGCKFKIVLLHPNSVEVFRKRGRVAGMSLSDEIMQLMVAHSVVRMKRLKASLPDKDRDKLMVKIHDDFVSVSIFGFDSEMLVGFYLHGYIAENNIQLKIHGRHTLFYRAFMSHFDKQWGSETNIDLEDYNPPEH